jgi:mutator protein MutT
VNLKSFRRRSIPLEERRPAAVAVTLAPNPAGRACLILTRRAEGMREHSGQWALPGGRIDAGETPAETARRELREEVGIHVEPEDVLGELDDFATRSGYVITPVVIWEPRGAPLEPNPREVAAAYRIAVAELDHPDGPVLTRIPESDRPVLSLAYRDDFIHAPTAAMVYQAIEVVFRGRETRVAHYEQPVFAWR